jgi:hypothetical protein
MEKNIAKPNLNIVTFSDWPEKRNDNDSNDNYYYHSVHTAQSIHA